METKHLIQSQAVAIKITTLAKGNVVKLIDEQYSDIKIKYAIVLELFNDGTKTFIQLLEYSKSYRSISAEIKVYGGDKQLNLFPADPEEVKTYFADAESEIQKEIKDKQEEIKKLHDTLDKTQQFITGELAKTLTKVDFEEVKSLN